MMHYLRGCGIHSTPDDNSGGRLGFLDNGHPGGLPWGCGIQDGGWYTLSNTVAGTQAYHQRSEEVKHIWHSRP